MGIKTLERVIRSLSGRSITITLEPQDYETLTTDLESFSKGYTYKGLRNEVVGGFGKKYYFAGKMLTIKKAK